MIIDGRAIPDGAEREADVCVVGSGPAGLFLSERLAENTSLSVAVLESGDLDFDPDIQRLAEGEVAGQRYFPLIETRIRQFGGTSWSWGGILSELDAIDFEDRPWVSDSGWPLRQEDLKPYVRSALDACGFSGGDNRPVSRWLEAGELPTGPSLRLESVHGSDMDTTTVNYLGPIRFGRTRRDYFARSSGITLYLRSSVTELRTRPQSSAVAAASVASVGGHRWSMKARVFVLAAGGIENPRLLLASRATSERGLGNSSGMVGRYFMEHPRMTDRVWLPKEARTSDDLLPIAADGLHFGRIRMPDERQRRERLLNYYANLYVGFAGQEGPQWESVRRMAISMRRPWNESPFLQDARGGPMGFYLSDFGRAMRHPVKTAVSAVGGALRLPRLRRYITIDSSIEQPPRADNRVVLDTRRDRLGVPLPKLHWTVGESVRETYEKGFQMILDHLASRIPGLSEQRIVRGAWPDDIHATWHHIGTTRMAADPKNGVVDPNCRVHDLENLYVAGSSVFPTGGATAPTLTIIALACRLADHLAEKL